MPVKIKSQSASVEMPRIIFPVTCIKDIFTMIGEKAGREFICTRVHALDPKLPSSKVQEYLESIHYGHHKDLENYAQVALERFNHAG